MSDIVFSLYVVHSFQLVNHRSCNTQEDNTRREGSPEALLQRTTTTFDRFALRDYSYAALPTP